ncbi:MAG: VanZ family protein [Sedimentisphaerales bacterium]|nr:VanZ family protein [Sedimentisphaerales bacterium]
MKRSKFSKLLPWILLIIYWPAVFALTHYPRLPSVRIRGGDKLAHFTAYLILTGLFWIAMYRSERPSLKKFKLYKIIILFGLYGALDEFTQTFVNRTCSFYDWLFDMVGCLTALFLLYAIRRWIYWLIGYWVCFFIISHWSDIFLTDRIVLYLEQFQIAIVMTGYLFLTLLWWRSLSPPAGIVRNKKILFWSLFILPLYNVLDEAIDVIFFSRPFDRPDFYSGLAGITVGIVCAMLFAQHNIESK